MERTQLQKLLQRIENEPRRFIQVLYGPRQVGKTTLVLQLLEKTRIPSHYATADAVTDGQGTWIAQQWEVARIKRNSTGEIQVILVLDEIQKIQNWSEQVKLEWERDTRNKHEVKVILLGSSRLLLQKGLTESLTGRFETMYLPHWSYAEMNALRKLSVDEFIWFGGYPGATDLFTDELRWKAFMQTAIIETSISRDILTMTRIDKPALLKQLFEIGATYSGQILSFTKILGQLLDAGNTTTLSHYLTLLDQAGLLAGIEQYSPDIIRQRSSSPKFQVHNTALLSALENDVFTEVRQTPTRWGRWVESAIGAHPINQCLVHAIRLHYWRHRNDEVDFVLEGKNKVVALEVKTGFSSATSGMRAFQKIFSPDKIVLIGPSGMEVRDFLQLEMDQLMS